MTACAIGGTLTPTCGRRLERPVLRSPTTGERNDRPMAITESTRHHLHQRLDEVLGPDDATTLMEHLPPVGWADVATKRDLDHLGSRTSAEAEHLGQRIDALAATTSADAERLGQRVDALAVATKRDLDHLGSRTTAEAEHLGQRIDALAETTSAEAARLGQRIDALAASTTRDIEHLAQVVDLKVDRMAESLRTELAAGLHRQTVQLLAAMVMLLTIAQAVAHFA